MSAAYQDAAFEIGRRLSEGSVYHKWLAKIAAFNGEWRLSEGVIH